MLALVQGTRRSPKKGKRASYSKEKSLNLDEF
jgi:hypothetical protein